MSSSILVRCVVIDDENAILDVFCELLALNNIDVVATGRNGKAAVDLYEKFRPDVIFLDLMMPEYDGFYAIEQIRKSNSDAKIVVVTANLETDQSLLLDKLNVSAIIYKPFDMHMINQVIADIILEENLSDASFKIQYRFKQDDKQYTCMVSFDQYQNFKKLPIIQECKVLNTNQQIKESYRNKMQEALDKAFKNDTTHIKMLSQIV